MADTAIERQEKAAVDIGVRFAGMVSEAVETMSIVARTPKLQRDKSGSVMQPEGMPDEVFHVHQDAMLPEKDVPFYLKEARGRVDLAHRISGDRSNAPERIAELVVRKLDVPKREYPVIDILPKAEE